MGKNKFPTTRPNQVALAQAMISGFNSNLADFPAPPISSGNLETKTQTALDRRVDRVAADAAAAAALDAETAAYDDLTDDMKLDLQYAEMVTKGDDTKLKEIGWSGRAAPTPLQIPGVPRLFEILEQGKGWAKFDWKSPSNGGKTAMYRVMRMEVSGGTGDWEEVASAIKTEATVVGQTNGKEYLFCAVAANGAGEGGQSNTVTAFL